MDSTTQDLPNDASLPRLCPKCSGPMRVIEILFSQFREVIPSQQFFLPAEERAAIYKWTRVGTRVSLNAPILSGLSRVRPGDLAGVCSGLRSEQGIAKRP
jgi:hypothetical protein